MNQVSAESSLNAVHNLLDSRLRMRPIRIYEAGGGSASFLRPQLRRCAEVTVLDIDAVQLSKNNYANNKILGDVQSYSFPENSFDLIVCYNVIEHLESPDKAIGLFFKALAPAGLLFIGAPNPRSFSGWVTRLTPHWFHVGYYRYALGYQTAGQPGSVPFRTVYHPVVSPLKLINFCQGLGLRKVYFQEYEGDLFRQLSERRPVLGMALSRSIEFLGMATGRKHLKLGDFHLIMEKPRR